MNDARSRPKEGQILFRVSEEEKRVMQQAAETEERTVSDWVRLTIRKRLRVLGLLPEKKRAVKKHEQDKE